ncbi:MAG: hypothetical protein JO072_17340 [Parafilimonas sp.]|nr:hypothetical protein [Parafilimonas sp.]
MKKSTLWFTALFILIAACRKDINSTNQVSANNIIDAKVKDVDTSGWYGLFFDPLGDPDDTVLAHHYVRVPADTLILNGEAKVPDAMYSDFSDSTEIVFDMPNNHTINADNTSFDVTMRNGKNKVELNVFGTNNKAKLTYKANVLNDSGYYSMSVGNTSVKFDIYPATDFTSFKLLRFAFTQNKAYVFVSNKLVTSFKYDQSDKIGNLTEIQMGKEGYIECDNVKLYNAFSRNLLMKEDFNIAGHSHTIFY